MRRALFESVQKSNEIIVLPFSPHIFASTACERREALFYRQKIGVFCVLLHLFNHSIYSITFFSSQPISQSDNERSTSIYPRPIRAHRCVVSSSRQARFLCVQSARCLDVKTIRSLWKVFTNAISPPRDKLESRVGSHSKAPSFLSSQKNRQLPIFFLTITRDRSLTSVEIDLHQKL